MTVYDCFMFSTELKLLEVRLHELDSVVDKFVLVEATRTHTGYPKMLYYEQNKDMFKDFQDKIIHVVVDDMPISVEKIAEELAGKDKTWIESPWQFDPNWVRERFQRNAIMRGLTDAQPNDIVIISDADEIVRASALRNLVCNFPDNELIAMNQTLHTYFLNWKCVNMPWPGTKILRYGNIYTPSCDRLHTQPARVVQDGGWHFGFMGGADAIRNKIQTYAHQEFNVEAVLGHIEERLVQKKDAIGRLYQYEVVPIDGSYPEYIQLNLRKFLNWIYIWN